MSRMRRTAGLVWLSLVLAIAVGATATSAQAYEWKSNGKVLEENVKKAVACGKSEQFTLTGTIVGTAVTIRFKEATCLKWEVWNKGGNALSLGGFELKEPAVSAPANCAIKPVKTKTLSGMVNPVAALPSKFGIKYTPQVGEILAEFTFEGALCALNEQEVALKGSLFAELFTLPTEEGVGPEVPETHFNYFTEETARKGGAALKMAGQAAALEGKVEFLF
jgi:hypothetical protein